jgi:hypothetical protein
MIIGKIRVVTKDFTAFRKNDPSHPVAFLLTTEIGSITDSSDGMINFGVAGERDFFAVVRRTFDRCTRADVIQTA